MALDDNTPAGSGFHQIFHQLELDEIKALGVHYFGLSSNPTVVPHPSQSLLSAYAHLEFWERSNDIVSASAAIVEMQDEYDLDPDTWLDRAGMSAIRRANLKGGAILTTPNQTPLRTARLFAWSPGRTMRLTPTVVGGGSTYTVTFNQSAVGDADGDISYVSGAGETVAQVCAGLVAAWNASAASNFSKATAYDRTTYVEVSFDGECEDDEWFDGTTIQVAATNGATITRAHSPGLQVMPLLFWGSSPGASAAVRMTTPWSGNQTTVNAMADWIVSGAEGAPTQGNVVIRLLLYPFTINTQLPEGEYILAGSDHQLDGGWPFITRDEVIAPAGVALWTAFLDALYARWEATLGPGHGWNIDVVCLDTEFKEERYSLGDGTYTWYTSNTNYDPGTTWYADFKDRFNNDHPTLAAQLYINNIDDIENWPATSGDDTYRYNEGVRQLQSLWIKTVVTDPMLAKNPNALISDYEDVLKAPKTYAGGVPGKRGFSAVGCGYTVHKTWSHNLYRSTAKSGSWNGGTMGAWFSNVGETTCTGTEWSNFVHDVINLQGGIAAAKPGAGVRFYPWMACGSAYSWNDAENTYNYYLFMSLVADGIFFWNSSPYETARDEALLLAALAQAYTYTGGKCVEPIAGPPRLDWSNATNRNQPISQDLLLSTGDILNITINRTSDSDFSQVNVSTRSNSFLASTADSRASGMVVRGAGRRAEAFDLGSSSGPDLSSGDIDWNPLDLGSELIALWTGSGLYSDVLPGTGDGALVVWNGSPYSMLVRNLDELIGAPDCITNSGYRGVELDGTCYPRKVTGLTFSSVGKGYFWCVGKLTGAAGPNYGLFSLGASGSGTNFTLCQLQSSGGVMYPRWFAGSGSGNTYSAQSTSVGIANGDRFGLIFELDAVANTSRLFVSKNGSKCTQVALTVSTAGTGAGTTKFLNYPSGINRLAIGANVANSDSFDTAFFIGNIFQVGLASRLMGSDENRIRAYLQAWTGSLA